MILSGDLAGTLCLLHGGVLVLLILKVVKVEGFADMTISYWLQSKVSTCSSFVTEKGVNRLFRDNAKISPCTLTKILMRYFQNVQYGT